MWTMFRERFIWKRGCLFVAMEGIVLHGHCLRKPPLFWLLKLASVDVVVVRVTSIVVMSWPLLLGGLLLVASPAMSGSIRPGYNMIPMSYPPNPLPYPPKMHVQPSKANRTIHRLSYHPEHDHKLRLSRYSRRVQQEIRRRTEAMMRRNSPSMKKIAARIALLGMVTIIVLALPIQLFSFTEKKAGGPGDSMTESNFLSL